MNQAGLDFYDKLVDETLAAGMAPICGMYTWEFHDGLGLRYGLVHVDHQT